MWRASGALPLPHAVALGLLQGPTELLPVSSSAHTALLPWFAGWPYGELDAELRKSFEVALHAGAGLALALAMRAELASAAHADVRRAAALVLALAPPALAGLALHERVERRLGGPRSIAAGLLAGAVVMAVAERSHEASRGRPCGDVGPLDGLALGLAQAAALVPGVSRSGAALSAARLRGFARAGAWRLSWAVALPVFAGATLLQGVRRLRAGVPSRLRWAFAAGTASAFSSTLASAAVVRQRRLAKAGLVPFAAYRAALAAAVLIRARRGARRAWLA
jgi:undecaprenyl-diphosphatase